MVEVKEEKFTDWRGTLRSLFGVSINKNSNNEEYKQWEEMNATDVEPSNKSVKGLEEETSAPKGGKVSRKQRKLSKTQLESTQMPTDIGEKGEDTRQRNGGGISR